MATLQSELAAERSARIQAERRAQSAERKAQSAETLAQNAISESHSAKAEARMATDMVIGFGIIVAIIAVLAGIFG